MLLCPWDFPGKSTGVGCHFLLQRIFLTQGSNLGLAHCRQTLYCLSHQGSLHLQCRRPKFDPWVGKIPWRRAWQLTSVYLPGESPWTKEPGGLQSVGSQRVGHDWLTKHACVLHGWMETGMNPWSHSTHRRRSLGLRPSLPSSKTHMLPTIL